MTSRRIVVTQRFFDAAARELLTSNGCEVVEASLPAGQADGNLSHAELVEMLRGAEGWIVGHARVTGELQEALPDLKVISRRGVGFERVDVAAAERLGKVVCIAAGGNSDTVAEHAIAMMLAVGHRLRETQARMQSGDWSILTGTDLFRKRVGVVGLGRIGRSLVRRLQGFECDVAAVAGESGRTFAAENDVSLLPLEEVLERSDYLSVHAPLTDATRLLIDAAALSRMPSSAILINTARGGLVDDRALLDALRDGRLAGAGLDVFVSESDASYASVTEALIALPNVVASPHSGASTREGLARTNMVAAVCALAVLDGGAPPAECVVVDGRPQAGRA